MYYNVDLYKNTFDPRYTPPLKFCEWQIRDCTTQLTYGFSTTPTRNEELQKQITDSKNPTKVPSVSRFMFVYGCLVQFPCYWVQLPASNAKMQPVVLTGPWNDTEMELTVSLFFCFFFICFNQFFVWFLSRFGCDFKLLRPSGVVCGWWG